MKVLAVAMAGWLAASGAVAAPVCKNGRVPVALCFALHGRLQAWNGTPTFRIARLGTSRVLGIEGEPYDPWLPDSVRRALGPDATGKRINADFEVCPLTKEKPGHMQMVCVIGASHVTERDNH